MIRLSGANQIEIVETGLRPGEKLYEELLVKTDELEKTSNDMIFVERDTSFSESEIGQKLKLLSDACATNDEAAARQALHTAVPSFRVAEKVNLEKIRELSAAGVK